MDFARPYSLVSPSADFDALAVLARTTDSLSGREIARRAGRSQEWTRKVLERLVEHGIAQRRPGGSALLYDLNRAHLAAPAVEQLVELRLLLVDRLRAELASWDVQPAAAALFGSAARGDGGTDSDIDLFVVRSAAVEVDDPVWLAQSDALATGVRAWTGNNASIVESSVEELVDLIGRAPPILDSIRADAIDLSDPPIRSLLRSAR